jgi:deoxyadenosine/deoxycytidine kinase
MPKPHRHQPVPASAAGGKSAYPGRLIAVIGNSGVGKTTLVRALCAVADFTPALEQHGERPFQAQFAIEHACFGLANQIDYLLYRAEQEFDLRRTADLGIVDGGLDLDFYGFTQLFQRRGYLTDAEFDLCARQHALLRSLLPAPDLYLFLDAPVEVALARHAARGRVLEIAAQRDLADLDELVRAWMWTIDPNQVYVVDASEEAMLDRESVRVLAAALLERLS